MINGLKEFIDYILQCLKWWITVEPWERGIRVRCGKRVKHLEPGMYLKLPILDSVYIQTIRERVLSLPIQTLTTFDGKTITLIACVGYSIKNVELLYKTVYNPESTIANIVLGTIADYIASNNLETCTPQVINDKVSDRLSTLEKYGLDNLSIKIVGYAAVKTYRFVMDNAWMPNGENLNIKQK